jgi:hypothetical protein
MAGLNFTLKTPETLKSPISTDTSLGLKTAALPQGEGWNSDRRDDSVENRVTNLMKDDSKLMRQAETAGLQQANKRGLLNSSMAVGATQNEAYRAALPIASQDASQAMQENLTHLDTAARFGMQGNEIASQFGMQANDIMSRQQLAELDVDARKSMQAAEIAYNTSKDQLAKYLAEMGNDTEQQRIMSSYMVSQEQIYSARLSDIMSNTNLTAAQRDQQLAAAKQSFTGHLDAISNILTVDVSNFMLWPGSATNPETVAAQQAAAAAAAQQQAAAAAAAQQAVAPSVYSVSGYAFNPWGGEEAAFRR